MAVFKSVRSINVVTLGCSKNLVDSEFLLGQLSNAGYNVFYDSESPCDLVLINTCGFINDAKKESLETIFRWVNARRNGLVRYIVVVGCLAQRYKEEILADIPEIDLVLGVDSADELLQILTPHHSADPDRLLITPPHYAYLKIAEGCDRTCSFCAIPHIRGSHRSLPPDQLIKHANDLAQRGVKELIIISQDTTYYGLDTHKRQMLAELLRGLVKIKEIEWIRLQYAYPASFPVEVLDLIRGEEKICRYLDIPFQHITDRMLKAMRRNISRKQTEELIDRIKTTVPGICLRTSLLCGFPGETDDDFNELLSFVKSGVIDRLGVFTYSHEEGTISFKDFKDNVPAKIKTLRAQKLMEAQQINSFKKNKALIGKKIRILTDASYTGGCIGRTEFDAPEADNDVEYRTNKKIKPGTFHTVKITDAAAYRLIAG